MSKEFNDLIQEITRLLAMTTDKRKLEGVDASTSQLKFLLIKINSNKTSPVMLAGVARFASDFSSSDSKILTLIDELEIKKQC